MLVSLKKSKNTKGKKVLTLGPIVAIHGNENQVKWENNEGKNTEGLPDSCEKTGKSFL